MQISTQYTSSIKDGLDDHSLNEVSAPPALLAADEKQVSYSASTCDFFIRSNTLFSNSVEQLSHGTKIVLHFENTLRRKVKKHGAHPMPSPIPHLSLRKTKTEKDISDKEEDVKR
jgi:hypothetical protein